jgi:hypothetical membrane protein
MRSVRWWALLSAGIAPIALIGGWAVAGALQPPGYSPVVQTISALAAHGATDRWVMTFALYALGVCHVVTSLGLRIAALPGRAALACGGVATMLVAAFPEPAGGGTSTAHVTAATAAIVALALWPVLASSSGLGRPWVLARVPSAAITVLLLVLGAWFLAELHSGGDQVGLAERVLTGIQALVPLAVTVGVARRLGVERPDPTGSAG